MNKRHLISVLIALFCGGFIVSANAESLLQVYRDAVRHDPTFKKAEYDWLTTRENLPIAFANYLPQVDVTGDFYRAYNHSTNSSAITTTLSTGNNWNYQYEYTISLSQAIFNLPAWEGIKQANAQVKAALATYLSAAQNLMTRVSTAYFNVLKAVARLQFTISNKKAVYQQLVTAEQKFKVGLIAITGVYDAQSVYDQAIASEISDRNSLMNQLENLRAITGKHYLYLDAIRSQVPLIPPTPNNIQKWVETAQQQNYDIRAQRYTMLAALDNIKVQSTARYPTVDFSTSWDKTYNIDNGPTIPNNSTTTALIGVTMNFTPFQGGSIFAHTHQAAYQYLSSSSQLVFTDREVIKNTRQAFLGVMTGISKIKADLQAIKSAKSALEATKAGYVVGTRTMVDVLNDLQALYQKKQNYADDQYNYLNDIITLKAAAGTLSAKDIGQISRWMKQRTHMNVSPEFYPNVSHKKYKKPRIRRHKIDFSTHVLPKKPSGGSGNGGSGATKTPTAPQPSTTLPGPTTTPGATSNTPSQSLPNQNNLLPGSPPSNNATTPQMNIPSPNDTKSQQQLPSQNNLLPGSPPTNDATLPEPNQSPTQKLPKQNNLLEGAPQKGSQVAPPVDVTPSPQINTAPSNNKNTIVTPNATTPNNNKMTPNITTPAPKGNNNYKPQSQTIAPVTPMPSQNITMPNNDIKTNIITPTPTPSVSPHEQINQLLKWQPPVPGSIQTPPQDFSPKNKVPANPSVKSDNQVRLKQSRPFYGIQIYSSRDEKAALQFINRHQSNQHKLYLIKSENKYKVILGQYNKLDNAQHALQQLPAHLQKHPAWITHVKSESLKHHGSAAN